jgi:hypothetical protein
MSQVKPVLEKLRRTLLGAGVLLLTSSVLLVGLIQTGTEDGVYGECRKQTGKPFGGAVRSQLWFLLFWFCFSCHLRSYFVLLCFPWIRIATPEKAQQGAMALT